MTARGLVRNLIGGVSVLAVLLFVALGLPALDRAVPASVALASSAPYEVGGGVTVKLPPGAQVDPTKTRPRADRGTALFMVGSTRYVIQVAPFPGQLDAAAERLRTRIQSTRGYQVTGDEQGITTTGGLTGLAGGYTAPGRNGKYAVFLANGLAIDITVSGVDSNLADIDQSIASISYRARS